ncbi:MAG: NTP transferase domain-containing protein [Pirellulales bacterium]|nr:NTP transferase domain-containing protein [Pirellulales bacterium]
MHLIVPMAGLGQRFVEAGFCTPKPLIPVSGLPMVVRVVNDLPPADRVVFVVHPEHAAKYELEMALRQYFPSCQVLVTPGLTAGQACTVRLAQSAIDLDDDVLVAACDATHLYDAQRFEILRNDDSIDCIVWTYRGEPRVLSNPTAYGWVRTLPHSDQIVEISCKRPISANLMADSVISGFFWFRSARQMFVAIDQLVAANRRVNNEFYLDAVPQSLIDSGRCVVRFEVEKYIGWGTPQDLEDYHRWEQYFARSAALV